jgi:hypothetical protein
MASNRIDPKIPPHDLQAEESVLAAILIDKDAILKVSEILVANLFTVRPIEPSIKRCLIFMIIVNPLMLLR